MLFLSLPLHLFILSSLFFSVKCNQLITESFESVINPDVVIKNCTIGELCTGSINATSIHYYSVQYSYIPDTTIRITTHMTYNQSQEAPILVVVRQIHGVVSWTLPYAFPNGMIYSSVARILCPHNEVNRSHPHTSNVFIEISTSNNEYIHYSIQLDNVSEYTLQPSSDEKLQRQLSVSPSMPVYYKVLFPNVNNIFITVESNDDFCAVVSVQSFDCPVYDVGEIGIRQGHYQTMSKRASFNVYFSEFTRRNEFLLVFLVKPTDSDCLDYREKATINPAGIIDIERTKNATVTITSPTRNYLFVAIAVTSIIFLLIYIIAFGVMWKYQDIYENYCQENIPLINAPREQELIEQPFAEPRRSTVTSEEEGEENVVESTRNELERQSSTVQVIQTSDCGFVTAERFSTKDYDYLKQKFRIYQTTLITIAIFYSLPVIQLVLQYQMNIDSNGNEDICYFNFLCTRELFNLTAFNNIFSNVGYCVLGTLLYIIVHRRDKAYTRALQKDPAMGKEYGIPQHFGLFYAMSIGLVMEGVMSACYHVCPSRQNFQFDTSFMFVIAVLSIIKIYQTRHADINPHSARTFSFLAAIIFITVIGVYYDKLWFWIVYATIHIIICVTFTGKIYYMGRLKISFRMHIHLYRLVKKNGFFSRPLYLNRMTLLVLANFINIGFALYGAISQPESFPNHLLFVFLGNLALYLFYYIAMKAVHKEKFTRSSIGFLTLSMVFWISSLFFFYSEVKSYEVQPAISRTLNRECILLDTYDQHDIWHLLSSFGLFFSFLSILTMDDGVRYRLRKELAAF